MSTLKISAAKSQLFQTVKNKLNLKKEDSFAKYFIVEVIGSDIFLIPVDSEIGKKFSGIVTYLQNTLKCEIDFLPGQEGKIKISSKSWIAEQAPATNGQGIASGGNGKGNNGSEPASPEEEQGELLDENKTSNPEEVNFSKLPREQLIQIFKDKSFELIEIAQLLEKVPPSKTPAEGTGEHILKEFKKLGMVIYAPQNEVTAGGPPTLSLVSDEKVLEIVIEAIGSVPGKRRRRRSRE